MCLGLAAETQGCARDQASRALMKMIDRKGQTIGQTLRQAWGGEAIGQYNGQEATRRVIPAGSYSLGFIIALQPTVVTGLLADADTGTPQRYCWSTANDPTIPSEPVQWPGQLEWDPTVLQIPAPDPGEFWADEFIIQFPKEIKERLRREQIARRRGEPGVQLAELDGQSPLMLVKLASLLALLDSRRGGHRRGLGPRARCVAHLVQGPNCPREAQRLHEGQGSGRTRGAVPGPGTP